MAPPWDQIQRQDVALGDKKRDLFDQRLSSLCMSTKINLTELGNGQAASFCSCVYAHAAHTRLTQARAAAAAAAVCSTPVLSHFVCAAQE